MSESAQKIIHPNVLQWASQTAVITQLTGMVEHVRLLGATGEASALIISPATSNTIGKIACGIDDTPVTTMAATAIGCGRKVVIVPAMHQSMYDNPFVRDNIARLKKAGVIFVGPRIEEGKAKIADEKDIIDAVKGAVK